MTITRPGNNPLYELAKALADDGTGAPGFGLDRRAHELAAEFETNPRRLLDYVPTLLEAMPGKSRLLLVIDQFEELFTLDDARATGPARDVSVSARQKSYVAVLEQIGRQAMPDAPIRAVATLRADFAGRALEYEALEKLMTATDLKLGPLSEDGLARAVELPARHFGVQFKPDLVKRIVATMTNAAGGLPLMQFALDALWRRQRDRWLTHGDYDAVGGVEGALTDHAEAYYARQTVETQAALRRVLTRLVRLASPGGQAEDTRAVVTRAEIGDTDWDIVQALAKERLVTADRDEATGSETAELVHEALISFTRANSGTNASTDTASLRSWDRLSAWLDEDREFGLWRQRLRGYVENYREKRSLLPEDLVAEAVGWLRTHGKALNKHEAGLIKASAEAKEQEEERKRGEEKERVRLLEENAQSQKNWVRRLGVVIACLLVAVGGAVYFGWSARVERDRARAAEEESLKSAREAKGRQLAADARLMQAEVAGAVAAERAAALAIEAWERFPSSQAYQVAATSIMQLPKLADLADATFWELVFSPSGTRVAAACHGCARILDTTSGRIVARLGDFDGLVTGVAFSPDSRRLAAVTGFNEVQIVDASSGANIAWLELDHDVSSLTFSPDGLRLVAGSRDGVVLVMEASSGMMLAQVEHDGPIADVTFSPDGTRVATASSDGTARIYDAASRTEIAWVEHDAPVSSVAFSPDGASLATVSEDHTVRILDVVSGQERARTQHGDEVNDVVFSSDSTLLATASDDGIVRIIDVSNGNETLRIEHDEIVWSVAFDAGDTRLATGSGSLTGPVGRATIFSMPAGDEIRRIEHDAAVRSVAFSPDARVLATGSGSGTIRIVDVTLGAEVARVEHSHPIRSFTFNPKGNHLATGDFQGKVRIAEWSGESEALLLQHNSAVIALAFSQDGLQLATADKSGAVLISDALNGDSIVNVHHDRTVRAAAFSSDISLLAMVATDNSTHILELSSEREIAEIPGRRTVMSFGVRC